MGCVYELFIFAITFDMVIEFYIGIDKTYLSIWHVYNLYSFVYVKALIYSLKMLYNLYYGSLW